MTWRLRVVHSTGFEYDAPVTSSYNEARLTPRTDARQNVILNRVDTVPATRAFRYSDYWGTSVTAFDLHAPHKELLVTGSTVVETSEANLVGPQSSWATLLSPATKDRFGEYLAPTQYVPTNRALATIAARLARGATPVDAVYAAAAWVHSTMTYLPGHTSVSTSAVQAWQHKSGVCQDYVHLTLLLLRAMGIPSRYVSGYLHPTRDAVVGETTAGESHSWIEAWTGSWWGFDPTNGIAIAAQHVSVGVGRDYADVSPLKGIYLGGGSTSLEVVVQVTRLA